MKDTNNNEITEEEFMKDIGHGVEMPNTMNEYIQENKKQRLKEILGGYCWFQDGGNGGYDFEDVCKFIENDIAKNAYNRGVEDSLKCVPTKVVNGKLREEKWKHRFGQSEINAYNLHRKQTIDNISKLLNNK